MAGTAFSASADADRRDSEADRDICIRTSCAFEFYIFAACLERRGCGAHDLTVLRLASCRTVSDLFYFHSDTSVVIEAVLRFFVGTLGFPTVIFILNCTFDALLKLCIKLFKLLQAVGTDIDKHGALIRDGIDGGSAVYDTDGEGSLRFSRGAELRDIGDGAAHGKDRIDKAEGTEGMSPRSAEGYLVAVASGAAVADQAACTVNGDKTVNLVGVFREEVAHAAEVSETFFADVAADNDISDRF